MSAPRIATWLLERSLPGVEGEAIVGDLVEEYHARRRAGHGASRARLWFWREAIAAIVLGRPPHDPSHDLPGDGRMSRFLADLRHGARTLRRAPAFTVICTITLALGIGGSTAIFSVVRPVLIEPLPHPDPQRLMLLWETDEDGSSSNTSFATFADLSREARTLAGTAAIGTWLPTISEGGEPERLSGERVSSTYFGVLGVQPALGRTFLPEEDAPGANRVVVLSDGLWRRRFGADSSIIGRTISLGGVEHEVIGVMPRDYENVMRPGVQVWRPLGYESSQPWACRTCRHLRMLVRVAPSVEPAAARAELASLMTALSRAHPRDYASADIRLVELQQEITRASRPILLVLLASVALLLLLATASVVNLQLTRALRRSHEFAVRAALGAGRARLLQQMLAEGLVLAMLGGAAGVLLARTALPVLLAQLPDRIPRIEQVRVDGAALLAALALTLGLGLAIGVVPAWTGGRGTAFGGLRSGARTIGGRSRIARSALVSIQVALALVLVAGAALLGRTLGNLLATDPGFDALGLLAVEVQAAGAAAATSEAVYASHDRLRERLAAIPGVVSVGSMNQLPLGGNMDTYGIRAQDRPLDNPALAPSGDRYVVSPHLMETLRVGIVRGRGFAPGDFDDAAPPVTILSSALATRIWGTDDVIGRRVQLGAPDSPWREVIGIARDVRHASLDSEITQQIWIPERQWAWADTEVTFVIRAHEDPALLASAVRRAVRDVDASQPITRLTTMDAIIAASTAQRRLALVLFGAFAVTAVLIAAAGIHGVLAGSVVERTREIGVRTALGATPGRIVALVLAQGAWLVGAGIAVGAVGVHALGRVLRSLLYGIGASDPATIGAVVLAVIAVSLIAGAVPVLRALRIQPAVALRD